MREPVTSMRSTLSAPSSAFAILETKAVEETATAIVVLVKIVLLKLLMFFIPYIA